MIRRNGNYSIGNKKFKPTELHGQRFYDWFDKAFKPVGSNPDGSILYSSQVSKGNAETVRDSSIIQNAFNGSVSMNKNHKDERETAHNQPHCARSVGFDETMEVNYDTTNRHISKSEISTNINAAGTRHISEGMLGKAEGEPNKSPSNLVQEKPSDSTSQPAEDNVVGKVCPVECRRTAGIFLVSHASARIFNTTIHSHPRRALAPPNEEPASDFALVQTSYFTISLQSCNCFALGVEGCIT